MRRTAFALPVLVLPCAMAVTSAPSATATACTIRGTDGDDVLVGTAGPDVICGLGGNDRLRGLGGDDLLYGGDAADLVAGGDGDDKVFGNRGDDTVLPGRGHDLVYGGDGVDTVSYQDLGAGVAIDLAVGTASGTEAGDDALSTLEGMTGTTGDDVLSGDAGDNFFSGLAGDDAVYPHRGRATVLGGSGLDRVNLADIDIGIQISQGVLRVDGFGRLSSTEVVVGTPHDDSVSTSDADEWVYGLGGDDFIEARGGRDVVRGGSGDDLVLEGGGDDDLDGGGGSDRIAYWRFLFDGVTVDLDAGTADKPDGATDRLRNFETLEGTFADDILRGGLAATEVHIAGLLGDDQISTLDGFPGDSIKNSEPGFAGACEGDPGDVIDC